MKKFGIDGIEYVIGKHGVIKQLYPEPYKYDAAYSAVYDTPEYTKQSDILQALRLGFINGVIGCCSNYQLLDVGYGNGAFMKAALPLFYKVYGYDVSGISVPDGCYYANRLDMRIGNKPFPIIATFWDCLEHFPDLDFLSDLPCHLIFISLPYCHFDSFIDQKNAITWFANWKHRKPNEHLFHFNERSLVGTLKDLGFNFITWTNIEDLVRKPSVSFNQNILTAAFRKIKSPL